MLTSELPQLAQSDLIAEATANGLHVNARSPLVSGHQQRGRWLPPGLPALLPVLHGLHVPYRAREFDGLRVWVHYRRNYIFSLTNLI